jgi:hypothetical protein
MSENTPVYGCDGCNTTGGRMSCPIHQATRLYGHRPNGTLEWPGDSFAEIRRLQAEIERLQGLLAEQDREFNAENLRAERAERRIAELERERDEARKALVWAWKNAQDYKENAPPDIYAIFKAARAAAKDDE